MIAGFFIGGNGGADSRVVVRALGPSLSVSSRNLAPGDMHESALAISLPGGGYTAIVRGHNGGTGVGVVEVYNVQ